MAKKILEINKFHKGTINNASHTDIEENTAKYSLNIDPQAAVGRLESINKSRVLTSQGWDSRDLVAQYIINATLNFSGEIFAANGTAYTDFLKNHGDGLSLGSMPTLGATITEMYDEDNVVTTNIAEGRGFTFSSLGSDLTTFLDAGGQIDGFLFDDGTDGTDGNIQIISKLHKSTTDSGARYIYDNTFVNPNGHDVSSGTIFYPLHMTFVPGQAIRFTLNDKFFYFWIKDLLNDYIEDPEDYIMDNNGNNNEHEDWSTNFLGKSMIVPPGGLEEGRGSPTDEFLNIRNYIFAAIKAQFEDSASSWGLTNYFDSVTQTTTNGQEQLVFNATPGMVEKFDIKLVTFHGLLGLDNLYHETEGAHGWTQTVFLDYDAPLYPGVGSTAPFSLNVSRFVTTQDKNNSDIINFVALIGSSNNNNIPSRAIKISDIYGDNIVAENLGDSFVGTSVLFDMLVDDDKVHIALGDNLQSTPKVTLFPENNPLDDRESTYDIFEASLLPPQFSELSHQYSYFYIPPIHGRHCDGLPHAEDGSAYTKYSLGISQNDTLSNGKFTEIMWPDFDVVLEADPTFSGAKTGGLWSCLDNTDNGTSTIKDLKPGQIFMTQSTTDFADGAMVAWKKYDYDASATAVQAYDLFMFCGFYGTTDVPILRYVGNSARQGGPPAFAYAIKVGDDKIYKISLVDSSDHSVTQFDSAISATVKDKLGAAKTIYNTGERITSCRIPGLTQGISAMYGAQSHTLFNNIGLEGRNSNYGTITDASLFYGNGHLKYYYRHGVFWVADALDRTTLKRVNLIDFHKLIEEEVKVETFSLDGSRIPSQLHAEDGDGIIRRTLEDKSTDELMDYKHDPKIHNDTWQKIPADSQIIGICETFESGRIDSREETTHITPAPNPKQLTFSNGRIGYKFRAMHHCGGNDGIANPDPDIDGIYGKHVYSSMSPVDGDFVTGDSSNPPQFFDYPSWRLATGDKVRFAGMAIPNDTAKKFNMGAPKEVNIVDDGRAMIIEPGIGIPSLNHTWQSSPGAGDSNYNETISAQGDSFWWNSKVWILYGKKGEFNKTFNDWDLFLYCVNTVDVDEHKKLYLADRTVPYSQARYYTNQQPMALTWQMRESVSTGSIGSSAASREPATEKIYYPGDSAFIMRNMKGHISGEDYATVEDLNADGPDGAEGPLGAGDFKRSGVSINSSDPCYYFTTGSDHVPYTDDNHPIGILGLPLVFAVKSQMSTWGIYDKAGRWSKNGLSTPNIHGADPSPRNVSWQGPFWYTGRGEDDSQSPSVFPFGIQDCVPFQWGENIGWEVNDESTSGRAIETIPGSLHPKNPYSQLYSGSRIYYNNKWGGQDGMGTWVGLGTYQAAHAVTFLGNTTGAFVVRPNHIARAYNHDDDDGIPGQAGVQSYYGLLGFTNYPYDESVIKNYNNTLTLYTIDDFSGHRGSVLYDTTGDEEGAGTVDPTSMEPTDANTIYVSGVKMGRPNVGGPEIENPYYYKEEITAEGASGTRWPFPSRNGGFSGTGANHPDDIGWDGYKPPYLFNPGKGYYVYINRRWKNQSPQINALKHFYDWGDSPPWSGVADYQYIHSKGGWDFQYDTDETDRFTWSNRRHNFSSTCIGDIVQTHEQSWRKFDAPFSDWGQNMNAPNDDGVYSATEDDLGIWVPGGNEYLRYKYTRFNVFDMLEEEINNHQTLRESTRTFGCNRNISVAVCTMQDIQVNNVLKINSVFPSILVAGNFWSAAWETDGVGSHHVTSSDFNVSYICGIDTDDIEPESGALIIRTNWDLAYTSMGRNTFMNQGQIDAFGLPAVDYAEMWMNGRIHPRYNMSTKQIEFSSWSTLNEWQTNAHQNLPENMQDACWTARNVGTHFAEVWSITNQTSYFGLDSAGTTSNLSIRGAAKDIYLDTTIASGITLFTQSPLTPEFQGTPSYSFTTSLSDSDTYIIQALSPDRGKLLTGIQENFFQLDEMGDVDVTFPSANLNAGRNKLIPYDSGGTFFTSNQGQIWGSTTDLDIWQDEATFLFSLPGDSSSIGTLEAGEYHYRMTYIYDKQYESPLTVIDAQVVDLPTLSNTDHKYNKIDLVIRMPKNKFLDMNKRITGIAVYRRFGGTIDDNYYHIKEMNFDDSDWVQNAATESFIYNVTDNGKLGPSYSDLNGIDQNIQDTSLNYGLMARFQGYLYVSQASHPQLQNVNNYIFRSQPENFFAFDWENDFVILPEKPKAMISFNSRLYVWGENKLYKIDPFSLVVEDVYDGISILNNTSFVKTEYGLCFIDKNNVYLHDGNQPKSLADSILQSSSKILLYESVENGIDGYHLLEDGYRELVQQTINNNHTPSIGYLAKKNSFIIHLSNKAKKGVMLSFNLTQQRWDMWEAPNPQSMGVSKDSDMLITDGTYIWNYLDAESIQYNQYHKSKWRWFSKDLTFGLDTQDKVFRGLSFLGTPSVFNYSNNSITAFGTDAKTCSIQAYVDDSIVDLTLQDTFYELVNLGDTYVRDVITLYDTEINLKTNINLLAEGEGVGSDNKAQQFIRPGHLIKIDNEIMLVTTISQYPQYSTLGVLRAQMNTTLLAHTSGVTNIVKVVAPRFKLPSGTKGKKLSIRLLEQTGYIDSIGISYKPKGIKI